jgi:tRNA 2-selenouridine synthase
MVENIKVTEALKTNAIFIDTRTPKEFQLDHLPNAINIPILSNEERHLIGITYKKSKEAAVQQGINYFSKKLPNFMEQVNKYKAKQIIFYCWRGGMRSRAVTALLESLNYNVLQLQGGYKAFREHVRYQLENYQLKPKLMVLWGLTCTGKTELLNQFSNSIDLEGLAQHRGSLYGGLGLKPHTQKRFDTLFLQRINQLNKEKVIFVEGESRKVGDVQIPAFFYKLMLQGTHILITRSLDKRAEFAVKEYFSDKNSINKIKEITKTLSKVISNKKKQEVITFIEGNKLKEAASFLLQDYYDPLYSHTLGKKTFSFEINNDTFDEAINELKKLINNKITIIR